MSRDTRFCPTGFQPCESEGAFADRAQRAAYQMWQRGGFTQACRVECVYEVPTPQEDPHFFDDERAMAATAW